MPRSLAEVPISLPALPSYFTFSIEICLSQVAVVPSAYYLLFASTSIGFVVPCLPFNPIPIDL